MSGLIDHGLAPQRSKEICGGSPKGKEHWAHQVNLITKHRSGWQNKVLCGLCYCDMPSTISSQESMSDTHNTESTVKTEENRSFYQEEKHAHSDLMLLLSLFTDVYSQRQNSVYSTLLFV